MNGKTYKFDFDSELLVGHTIGEEIDGSLLSPELEGYKLIITGTSDKSGFCGLERILGPGLHKVLLSYERGMHTRPKKEGKKPRTNKTPKGLRLRKTVRGKEISLDTVQVNTNVISEGKKKFSDLFAAPVEE
jgi:small subunit ribosomal protein S6e